jgi:hypothetical protein
MSVWLVEATSGHDVDAVGAMYDAIIEWPQSSQVMPGNQHPQASRVPESPSHPASDRGGREIHGRRR